MPNPLTKLFQSKEFYMELDEAEAGKVESEAPAAAVPAKQPEPAKEAAATPEKQPKPSNGGPLGAVNKLFQTKELYLELDEAETGKVKSEAPAKKKETAKKQETAKEQETAKVESKAPAKQPKPVKAVAATAQPVKAVASTNGKVEPQPGVTFAPNSLLPLATSRRRPGPSMNKFREMARGVKTPK